MTEPTTMHIIHVSAVGRRPPYGKVAEYLWGAGCNIDSDGNSRTPDDEEWTELTLSHRDGPGRVDVDPLVDDPLILAIKSEDRALAEKVAAFIAP